MSEFTTIHLGQNAKSVEDSPSFQPFSMVRIIVGEDDSGTQIVYEAGEPSGRVLEVTNPWGTQQMANDMLAKIQGYQYKPFTADGALINPAAELGDAVTVGNVYSVINSSETTFSPIMSSTISAHEGSTIDHEYPYEDKQTREVARTIKGLQTSFTVELGKIESEIIDPDTGESRITQLADSITAEVRDRTNADLDIYSAIQVTANGIESTVASAQAKYDIPAGTTISLYGYGTPTYKASDYRNQKYLDQATGYIYTSNGSSWVKSSTPLTKTTDNLSSRITQTASEIRAEVNGIYADEWETGTGSGSSYYYNYGDVVKVTDDESVTYYKCIQANDSNSNNKPGIGAFWRQYWDVTTPSSVQSMIDLGLDGITIGYQESDLANSATITLNKNGIQMQAQAITMSNVVADEIAANTSISSPIIYNKGKDTWFEMKNQGSYGYGSGISVKRRDNYGTDVLFDLFYDSFGRVSVTLNNYTALYAIDDLGEVKIKLQGTWDFSDATVIGI